jgi:hypothetical protein
VLPEQEEGLTATTLETQLPFTAVNVTSVPTGIPVTLFPLIVPELGTIVAPVVSTKLNSQFVPLQIPLPTVNTGVTQDAELGQSELGVNTLAVVIHEPLVAEIVIEVFLGALITLDPLTVPAEDVTLVEFRN